MDTIHLKIITPRKIVKEEDVTSLTAPSSEGEITILPRHEHLFSLLVEGIVKIKKNKEEDLLAIGGGYLETDGKNVTVLVSRAYGQDEIDEVQTAEAIKNAKKIIVESNDQKARQEAQSMYRRSTIDMKLIKRKKQRPL